MNDDFWNIIRNVGRGNTPAPSDLDDLITNYKNYMFSDYNRKDDMAYSYSSTNTISRIGDYYHDTRTRGDEVATAVLEAYANGVEFETLIKKNKTVRQYWSQIQSEKAATFKRAEQEKTRLAKLAEKRAAEQAKREEVMSKLSMEELEAFGFVKKESGDGKQ
jgi:selenocysteine lyase/cysteine desulfurase